MVCEIEEHQSVKNCKPVVCEVPSYLCQVSAVAFLHILSLVYSLHDVEQMLVWVLYVKVEPERV